MGSRSKPNWGKRIVWLAGGCAVLALLAAGVAWMAFQHIPAWYAPRDVADSDLPRVRNGLPNTYQAFTDQVMAGRPFTFRLSDTQVTEWIVARAELYPDAREWLPPWLHDPVVVFRGQECIVGARIDYQGWQAVIGLHLVAEIDDDHVNLRLVEVTAGALPVPLSRLADPIEEFLNSRRLDIETMPDPVANVVRKLRSGGTAGLLETGIQWPNGFRLRNGRREIKLRGASTENGELLVEVEPQ